MSDQRIKRRVDREYKEIYDQHDENNITAFERQKKRRRRKKQWRRRLLIFFIVAIIGSSAYAMLPMSKVKIVNVYENSVLESSEVATLSKLTPEKSSYSFTPRFVIKKRLLKSPYLVDATVEKRKGNQIDITVTERQMMFKTTIDDKKYVHFADGTRHEIEEGFNIDAATLSGVELPAAFPYEDLAKNLGTVPFEIVEQISEIVHSPSDMDVNRYTLLMKDGNRVIVLLDRIPTHLKWYNYMVEIKNNKMGDARFEFYMEYTEDAFGRKI